MVWQLSGPFHLGLIALTGLFSALMAYLLMHRWRRGWIAVPVAWLSPILLILGYFFYLESQQPIGPFFALVGLYHAVPAMVAGAFGAGAGLLVFLWRDDQA